MNIVKIIFDYTDKKWNNKELASYLGISEAVLSRIRNSVREPSFTLLILLGNKIPPLRKPILEYIKSLFDK